VALTVKVAGWLLIDRRVVDGDGNLCAITAWGQSRAERRRLRRWLEREVDDEAGSIAAWAALEKP
jgi:hypothetical protein